MKNRLIILPIIAGIVILLLGTFFVVKKKNEIQMVPQPDSFTNPDYSKYKSKNNENVIKIGVQPLYMPTGLITEAMKRDNILREALLKLGIKIKFYAFLKGDDVNTFLKNGFLVAGVGGDMPAISASISLDVIIPSLMQWGYTGIVAKRDMQVRDLRGKNIGYALGSNAHYTLLYALETYALPESQVNLIPMNVDVMPAALHTGKIDAFAAWEPTITIALTKYPETAVIHKGLSSGYLYFLKSFFENNPEAVRQIVAAQIRALRWIRSSRQMLLQTIRWTMQECEKLSGHRFQLSVEQTAKLTEKDLVGLDIDPLIQSHDLKPKRRLQLEFILLQTIGKLPLSAKWQNVHRSFDYSIINEVLSNHEKYNIDLFDYKLNNS